MKKTLILMRHGEAASMEGEKDFERHLTPKGVAMAKQMGAELATRGMIPDKIISSPAIRTRETCDALLSVWTDAAPVVDFNEKLYGADASRIFSLIRAQSGVEKLMIVGHNPWIHALPLHLCGLDELAKKPALKSMYPAAAITILSFDAQNWDELSRGRGTLADFFFPTV